MCFPQEGTAGAWALPGTTGVPRSYETAHPLGGHHRALGARPGFRGGGGQTGRGGGRCGGACGTPASPATRHSAPALSPEHTKTLDLEHSLNLKRWYLGSHSISTHAPEHTSVSDSESAQALVSQLQGEGFEGAAQGRVRDAGITSDTPFRPCALTWWALSFNCPPISHRSIYLSPVHLSP